MRTASDGRPVAEARTTRVAGLFCRCGRGGKILEDLVKEAEKRGVKRIFLEVRVSNAPAMSLYLKHGFRGLYARVRYYPDGEDALVMVKVLG